MARGEHEAVAVGPDRVGGVEAQEPLPERVGDRGERHRRSRMARVRLLDRVDGEGADRVHAEGVDLVPLLPDVACLSRAHACDPNPPGPRVGFRHRERSADRREARRGPGRRPSWSRTGCWSGSARAPPSPTCCPRSPSAGSSCAASRPRSRPRSTLASSGSPSSPSRGWRGSTSRSTARTRSRPTAGSSRAGAAPTSARRSSPPPPTASSSSPTPRSRSTRSPRRSRSSCCATASTRRFATSEDAELRDVPASPDDGLIADYRGEVGDPSELAARLAAVPGVVDHGLFEPELTATILIARGGEVERKDL